MSITDNRMALLETVSEKTFMAEVVNILRSCGWRVYHTFDSQRSERGYPDITAVHPSRRPGLILAELKSQKGRVSQHQQQWLDALQVVADRSHGSLYVGLWRPSDLDEVARVARGLR